MLLVNAQDVPCVSYMHLALGVEAEVVETTDVREGIMEEELKVATEEFTSEAPAVLEPTGKQRTHCTRTYCEIKYKAILYCMHDVL